jgi:glycosyltransferase involved in cell wall biosynthesis
MPKVSIIIPSYNHEKYVGEAIQSVLNQTFQDFEIIVVDDASSDATVRIIEGITDPRIRLIKMTDNRAVHTRNLALSLAEGEYVAFQNSDDRWDPQKLQAQVAVLDNQPNVVACFTGVESIDVGGATLTKSFAKKLFVTRNRTREEWLQRFFETGNCLCITSSLVRREAIETVGGFRESLVQMGDLDLWVQLAGRGDFHILDVPLTHMRITEKNMSTPTSQVARRSVIEYSEILFRYAEQPLCDCLAEVFSYVFNQGEHTSVTRLAGLARYASGLGVAQRLFADRLTASLLDDPKKRAEIVALYGNSFVLDFIRKRGELEVTIQTS